MTHLFKEAELSLTGLDFATWMIFYKCFTGKKGMSA